MKITPNYTKNASFKGRLILKGNYTKMIKKAFFENQTMQNLAKGDYDIIGIVRSRVIYRKSEAYREGREVGDVVYKFTLTAKKSAKTFLEKILRPFSKKHPTIKAYRSSCSEESLSLFIRKLENESAIKAELNI